MERHETTTETATRSLRSVLLRSAGWLAVALMLALSSPGVQVERLAGATPAGTGAAIAPALR